MNVIETDVLVIGGGSAATRAALSAAAAGARVILADKGTVGESGSSPHALVGLSIPLLDPADSEALFLEDWDAAGGGIADADLVAQCARHGRWLAEDLERRGVEFIRGNDGAWFLSRRAGHSARRTLMAVGKGKGVHANVIEPMRRSLAEAGVVLHENTMITRLLKDSDGKVAGGMAMDSAGNLKIIRAGATVLASGGANRLFTILCEEVKDHGSRTTGDSYALAFHAGASLIDMEFAQFRDSPPAGPIYGAHYLNALGERIMERYDPENMECAPRYMMGRAVYTENFEGRGPVTWLVEEGQVARSRAPVGDFKAGELVEITLMFQRLMGGARIDANAATSVPGLFAAGEASGGVHGGDRMQGCGFLETQTFGAIAGHSAALQALSSPAGAIDRDEIAAEEARLGRAGGSRDPAEVVEAVQQLMWSKAGVVSNEAALETVLSTLSALAESSETELKTDDKFAAEEARNLILTGRLVASAKLARTETRSGHGRTDYPDMDANWQKHVCLAKSTDQAIVVDTVPVRTSADISAAVDLSSTPVPALQ